MENDSALFIHDAADEQLTVGGDIRHRRQVLHHEWGKIPRACLEKYIINRINVGYLRSDDSMYRLDEAEYIKRIRRLPLEKDDIVYGREGERWGLACIIPESDKYCLGQRMMQFRCNGDIFLPEFARWALNSNGVYMQGTVDTIGSTSPHVNISTMRNYAIPIPPVDEQKQIAKYVTDRCDKLLELISRKEAFIAELESYKKSLIYEYVTGKKSVE